MLRTALLATLRRPGRIRTAKLTKQAVLYRIDER